MNHMTSREITRSAAPSTESLASGDVSTDDLPNVVVNQDTEATAILDVAVIADGDLGRIGKATFKSEGTGLGDIAPSSEPVPFDTDRPAAAEAGFPTLRIDVNENNVIRDGGLPLAEEDTAPTGPLFTPRGPLTKPSDVERPHTNPRDGESKGKKGSKTKGSKDKPKDKPKGKPDSGQKEKKQTGCIIM